MRSSRAAKLGCVIRPIEAADEALAAKTPAAPKRGPVSKSSIMRVVETREDLEQIAEKEPASEAENNLANLHGFKKRDKPFVYIPSGTDRKPGQLLAEDKKKAQAEVRARKYKPDVVTDRLLRKLLS